MSCKVIQIPAKLAELHDHPEKHVAPQALVGSPLGQVVPLPTHFAINERKLENANTGPGSLAEWYVVYRYRASVAVLLTQEWRQACVRTLTRALATRSEPVLSAEVVKLERWKSISKQISL